MILIAGTVRFPPDTIHDLKPAMAEMLSKSRAEDGCIQYSYAIDVQDAGLLHVSEAWCDRHAIMAHTQTPHMAAWRTQCGKLGITDRNLRLYETDEGEAL